jgi:HlyD family secretion protein
VSEPGRSDARRSGAPRIIAALAIVALAIVGLATRGFGLLGSPAPKELTLSGNVDIRQVDLGFRVAGRVASVLFEEGAHVTAAALLASLDARPFKDQLAINEAAIASASALLDKQRNGNRAQDIAEAEAKLAELNAQMTRAKQDFDRRTRLVTSGTVSQSVFESSRSQFLTAQAQVRSAQQALSLERAGARKEDIAAALARRNETVAERDKTATDIADCELHAPNDGVILTRAREPGAIVQAGETVLTLTIERPMRVRAYIDETDLGRISPGMNVSVTTDSNPKTYHGSIGYIAPTAEFTPKTVQTQDLRSNLVYGVRVIIEDPDDGLRQGQPVTVRIAAARGAADSRPTADH